MVSNSLSAERSVKRPISPMQSSVYTASIPLTPWSLANSVVMVGFIAAAATHAAATHLAKLCATN